MKSRDKTESGLFFTRAELQLIRNRAHKLMMADPGKNDSPLSVSRRRAWSNLMDAADHAEAMIARLELETVKQHEMGLDPIPGHSTLKNLQDQAEAWKDLKGDRDEQED